ncbi:acyltransferase [Aphanothece microscopica]|uniref:acyltransferase n=1 Tax=Aphanothece microscopica TaxID=1049561 RepID=UPI003984C743
MKRIGYLLWDLLYWSVVGLPGPIGRKLRSYMLRLVLKECGVNVVFDTGVAIENPQFVTIKDNCWIDRQAIIIAGPITSRGRKLTRLAVSTNGDSEHVAEGEVVIAHNCHIGPQTVVQGHGGVYVGQDVTLAAGSKVYSAVHDHMNRSDRTDTTLYKFSSMAPEAEQSLLVGPVHIGAAAAVGLNAIILPGVRLGRGAWLGAGSVATRDIPDKAIAVGSPAQVTRKRITSAPGF